MMIHFLLFFVLTSVLTVDPARATSCKNVIGKQSSVKALNIERLNDRLSDPAYRVLVLARHGRASAKNKFSAKKIKKNPKKGKRDIKRPLIKSGKKAAKKLAKLMKKLSFQNVGVWGSKAKRVRDTFSPTKKLLGDKILYENFEKDLYYADVPAEMGEALTTDLGEDAQHAFFWGHGETTFRLVKKMTNADDGFIPTGGVVVIAVKAKSWKKALKRKSKHVEVYMWSPNNSHHIKEKPGKELEVFEL